MEFFILCRISLAVHKVYDARGDVEEAAAHERGAAA